MYICGESGGEITHHTRLTVRPRLKEAVSVTRASQSVSQRSICFFFIKIGYNGYCQRGF